MNEYRVTFVVWNAAREAFDPEEAVRVRAADCDRAVGEAFAALRQRPHLRGRLWHDFRVAKLEFLARGADVKEGDDPCRPTRSASEPTPPISCPIPSNC